MSSRVWRDHANLLLDVARGGAGIPVVAFGRNPDVDTAAAEDLVDAGGDFVYPSSAETLEIVSTDTNDDGDPAGTGARTVTITGLDEDYNPLSQTVTMNGTTAVVLSGGDYLRVFSIKVITAGTSGPSVGQLTLQVSVGGATRAIVLAGWGCSNLCTYTVPAGKTGYIIAYDAGILLDVPTTPKSEVGLMTREFSAAPAWHTRDSVLVEDFAQRSIYREYPIPLRLPEKSDVRLRALNNTVANTIVCGTLHIAVMEE